MTGRTPACEDAAAISARLREIQQERMAILAGCSCPQRDVTGNTVHTPLCPLRAAAPSQMEMTLEAMRRARERLQRGLPARLTLPSDAPLTDEDMAELRALWILQTQAA